MTTTETKKKIAVTMSERSPLKLDPELWPRIARVGRHDGAVACQANTEWYICVREHADGRRVVYGGKIAGNGGQYAGFRDSRGGYLIEAIRDEKRPPREVEGLVTYVHPDEEETIRAIRRVAGIIGDDQLGDECIGDLPAEELV
jgi:hypothetical protein